MATPDEQVIGVNCNTTEPGFVLEKDGLAVHIRPLDDIAVSQPFPVSLTVCGDDPSKATVTLDASMPSHGHAMNYAPLHTVTSQSAEGLHILVEGMVLHMPGNWQWSVDIRSGTGSETLTEAFKVQ